MKTNNKECVLLFKSVLIFCMKSCKIMTLKPFETFVKIRQRRQKPLKSRSHLFFGQEATLINNITLWFAPTKTLNRPPANKSPWWRIWVIICCPYTLWGFFYSFACCKVLNRLHTHFLESRQTHLQNSIPYSFWSSYFKTKLFES